MTITMPTGVYAYCCGLLLSGILLVIADPYPTGAPPDTRLRGSPCERSECMCAQESRGGVILTCTCERTHTQELLVSPSSLPPAVTDVYLADCPSVTLHREGTSSPAPRPSNLPLTVTVRGVSNVTVAPNAFHDIAVDVTFNIAAASHVSLHTGAFRNVRKNLSVSIVDSQSVNVARGAFSWVDSLLFRGVQTLLLNTHSFALNTSQMSQRGATTVIKVVSSHVPSIPTLAFPTSVVSILFNASSITRIEKDAFFPLNAQSISFLNCRISSFDSQCFSGRTHLSNLNLERTNIHKIRKSAFSSGVYQLVISNCKIDEIEEGGVNGTVVSLLMANSSVGRLSVAAFSARMWSSVTVRHNSFDVIETGAFGHLSPSDASSTAPVFSFVGNHIIHSTPGCLALPHPLPVAVEVTVTDNVFDVNCRCDGGEWMRSLLRLGGSNYEDIALFVVFYNSSFCRVNPTHAVCLDVDAEFLSLADHTDLICGEEDALSKCTQESTAGDTSTESAGTSNTSHRPQTLEHGKRILLVIFLSVVCSVAVLCLTMATLYARRKKSCHGCAPLLQTTLVSGPPMCLHGAPDEEKDIIQSPTDSSEDKAVQTMPSELTAEILQSLREKLDDPCTASEAIKDIEYLYDLIKVEEDDVVGDAMRDRETPYEPVSNGVRFNDVVVGTHPAILEYTDPRDTRVHIYTEVPSRVAPSKPPRKSAPWSNKQNPLICEYADPKDSKSHLYTEIQQRPLPTTPPNTEDLYEQIRN